MEINGKGLFGQTTSYHPINSVLLKQNTQGTNRHLT